MPRLTEFTEFVLCQVAPTRNHSGRFSGRDRVRSLRQAQVVTCGSQNPCNLPRHLEFSGALSTNNKGMGGIKIN